MLKPKVSVIIPVYNVEKYIEQCLDSVVNQTLSDIEILVISDATPDGSMKYAEEYQTKDNRVRLLYNQSNSGLGATRNIGILNATGECICFVDSDDWIEPNALQIAYKAIKCTDSQFVEFGVRKVDERGNPISVIEMDEEIVTDEQRWLDGFSRNYFQDFACNKLFIAKFIKENHIIFRNDFCSEDTMFSIESSQKADKITIITDILYNYRQHPFSISYQPINEKQLDDGVDRVRQVAEMLDMENLLLTDIGHRMLGNYVSQARQFVHRYTGSDTLKYKKLEQYAKKYFNEKYALAYAYMRDSYNQYATMIEYFEMQGMDIKQFSLFEIARNATAELIRNNKISEKDKVLIYGSGEWGKRFYHTLTKKQLNVIAFIDSNEKKWGSEFCGCQIVSSAKIRETEYTKIVLASSAFREIKGALITQGVAEEDIIKFDFMRK